MKTTKPKDIESYIAAWPPATQRLLRQLLATIRQAAPGAQELISYRMPAFKLHGVLVYFAAYERHLGLYPMATGIAAFQRELAAYKSGKGSVQFPLDRPLPLGLITRIVKHRVKANLAKRAASNRPARRS